MFDHFPSTPVIKVNAKAAANLKLDLSLEVSIANFEQRISTNRFGKQTCACDANWKGIFCNQQSESKLYSVDNFKKMYR